MLLRTRTSWGGLGRQGSCLGGESRVWGRPGRGVGRWLTSRVCRAELLRANYYISAGKPAEQGAERLHLYSV